MDNSKTPYTPSQQQVLKSNKNNLLVSAGAGSGKTTVLVQKAVEQIKQKEASLSQLLIVTFTESASAEMKQRLLDKLSDYAADPLVAKELESLYNSDICTLHSFCQKIIKQYFYEIDVDPAFGIIDDNDASFIKAQILQQLLQDEAKQYDSAFESLTEVFYRGRSDSNLKENILSFYEFLQTEDDRENFLNNIANSCYNTDLNVNPATLLINKKVCRDIEYFKKRFGEKLLVAQGLNQPKTTTMLSNIVEGLKVISIDNDFKTNFENMKTVYSLSGGFGRIKTEDAKLIEECSYLWSNFGDTKDNIKKLYCLDNLQDNINNLQLAGKVIDKFVELTLKFEKQFIKHKQSLKVLDFNDLEKYALKLLSNPTLQKALVDKYKYIYIDEYQDINNIQEKILNLLTNGKNLIMVGDIKQSIYAFRNSSPQIFIDKKLKYEQNPSLGEVVNLNENFRSNPLILEFINQIFNKVMTEDFGGVDYKNKSSFNGKAEYLKVNTLPEVSINLAIEQEKEDQLAQGLYDISQQVDKTVSTKQAEAQFVATKITELVDPNNNYQIYDAKKKQSKPIEYKDITILCRTRTILKEFATMLGKYNIPISASLQESMFEDPDVLMVLSLLKLVNNLNDDIALATVLAHDIVGFDCQDLITIRQYTQAPTFYQACKNYLEASDDLAIKLKEFFDYFEKLHFESKFLSIYQLLLKLDNKYNILNYYLALPSGRDRYSVINNYITSFAGSSYNHNLIGYLNYVDTYLKDSKKSTSIVANENCVKLDTIHSSKGLEYNIVFLVGCGEGFSKLTTKQDLVKNKALGLGVNYYDTKLRASYDTWAKRAITLHIRQSELLEETRLLYVALSRAKNHLYIVGKIQPKTLVEDPTEFDIRHADSYIEWILAGLDHNSIAAIKNGNTHFISRPNTLPVEVNVFDTNIQAQYIESNIKEFDTDVIDKDLYKQIQDYLDKPYDNQLSTTIAQKNSVTSLMSLQDEYESINLQPKLFKLAEHDSSQDIDYAKLGTAYHTVMQHIDFNLQTLQQVKDAIQSMIDNNIYLPEYLQKVSAKKILSAINNLKGITCGEELREKQFMMYVPYNQVLPSSSLTDKVLLQGVIDLMVVGEQNIIVDYKTTRTEKPEQLVDKYHFQMSLYRMAAEQASGKNIDKVYIYSFYHDQLVQVF